MACFRNSRHRRRGIITLEWILLITVVVIGIIGGLGAIRNATVSELSDMAEAIEALNVKTGAECEAETAGGNPCTPSAFETGAEGS